MSKKAILYARVSSALQGENYSLTTQLEACQKYAEQQGFSVVGQFADTVSGTTLTRPGLEQARKMIKQKQADVLIVYSMDRFSRNVADFHLLKEELQRLGIEYHVTTRGKVKDTPEGNLQSNIEVSFADYERRRILERFDRGRRGKLQGNKVLGNGIRPYGYTFTEGKGRYKTERMGLEILEDEAEIVRLIYQWYIVGDGNGPVTVTETVRRLTQMGVPSYADTMKAAHLKKRGRGQWCRGSIYNILRKPLYKGEAVYDLQAQDGEEAAQPVVVAVPAIVDPAMWEAAQRKLEKGKELSKRNMQHEYLLAQRVKCACGYRMHGRSSGKYLVYRCNARPRDYMIVECKMPTYPVPATDAVVWNWVYNTLLDPENLAKGIKDLFDQTSQERKEWEYQQGFLTKKLQEAETKLQRVSEVYVAGDIDRNIYLKIKHDTEAERGSLAERLEAIEGQLANLGISQERLDTLQGLAASIRQELDLTSFEDKRKVLALLNVEAFLYVEEGRKKVHVRCALPNFTQTFPIESRPLASFSRAASLRR